MARHNFMHADCASDAKDDTDAVSTPGFALYAVGIFLWMTFVSCCGATYALPFTPPQAEAAPYVLAQQGAYVLTFFVTAVLAWKHPGSERLLDRLWQLTIASFVGFLTCLVAYELGLRSSWLIALYGLLLGVGMTSGYVQWATLVAARPQSEVVRLILVASLGSIVSGVILCFIPAAIRILLAAAVFMPASLSSLYVYRARHGSLPPTDSARPPKNDGADGRQAPASKARLTVLLPSIACAVVLSLAAPIVSAAYMGLPDNELARNLVAQAANLFALGVLAGVMLLGKRRLTIPEAYRVMLPIMATAVLVGAFFEPDRRWFVLFLSEACFCVVSLLILLESCAISRETGMSPMLVYGVLGGFVYLARTPEAIFSLELAPIDAAASPIVMALLLYLLVIPSFTLPLFSRASKNEGRACAAMAPAPVERLDTDAVCASLAKEAGLTPRQADVMRLLVKGVSTQRIAEDLGLSENTVATYRKVVYAALDVHARQELLDLVEMRTLAGDRAQA